MKHFLSFARFAICFSLKMHSQWCLHAIICRQRKIISVDENQNIRNENQNKRNKTENTLASVRWTYSCSCVFGLNSNCVRVWHVIEACNVHGGRSANCRNTHLQDAHINWVNDFDSPLLWNDRTKHFHSIPFRSTFYLPTYAERCQYVDSLVIRQRTPLN